MVEIRTIHQELDMVARRLESSSDAIGCSPLLMWIMLKQRAEKEIQSETLTEFQSTDN
tara:strand:+ start:173 stop:346 length:174 start_codon:yes stop_codon:yes gene_type:complete